MASGATRAAASRGAFVLFEGADRCGKSTQASRLVTRLNADGVRAELWRYPDRTTAMGKMIDEYLQSKAEMTDGAIHLLFAVNVCFCEKMSKREPKSRAAPPHRTGAGVVHQRALQLASLQC